MATQINVVIATSKKGIMSPFLSGRDNDCQDGTVRLSHHIILLISIRTKVRMEITLCRANLRAETHRRRTCEREPKLVDLPCLTLYSSEKPKYSSCYT